MDCNNPGIKPEGIITMIKTYLFNTNTTMKPHNAAKWWIMNDIIKPETIAAGSIKEALKKYQDIAHDKYYIDISNNALKTKSPMYIDKDGETIQTGYVITGKTDFEDRDNYKWSKQYIDLWIDIQEVNIPTF